MQSASTFKQYCLKEKSLIELNFFPLVLAFGSTVFFLFSRRVQNVEYFSKAFSLLFLGFFLLSFPITLTLILKWLKKEVGLIETSIFFLCALVSILGTLLLQSNAVPLFSTFLQILGIVSAFTTFALWFQTQSLKSGLLSIIFFSTLSIFISSKVWTAGYLSPTFIEDVPRGIYHTDTLYHASISSMIMNYSIASTGIDGLVPLKYHFGTHLFTGAVSKLINATPLETLQLLSPSLLHPLFLQSIFILIIALQKRFSSSSTNSHNTPLTWLIILSAYIGFLPLDAMNRLNFDVPQFFSDSQTLATALSFWVISFVVMASQKKFIQDKPYFFLTVFAFLILIGITKISHIAISSTIIVYFLLRENTLPKRRLLSVILVIGVLNFLVLWYFRIPEHTPHLFPLAMFMKTIYHHWKGWWLILTTIWSLIFFWFFIKHSQLNTFADLQKAFSKKLTVPLELLSISFIITLLPGLFLIIPGGGALYFYDVHRWFSIALLACFLSTFSINLSSFTSKKKISLFAFKLNLFIPLILFTCLITTMLINTTIPILSFSHSIFSKPALTDEQISQVQTLLELKKISQKISLENLNNKTTVNVDFAQHLRLPINCHAQYLLTPALTSFPSLYSSSPDCSTDQYSFLAFVHESNIDLCKRKAGEGFEKILKIEESDGELQIVDICE